MNIASGDIITPGPRRIIRQESLGWSIAVSVLLIMLGLAALALPFLAGVAVTAIIAWLLIFSGVAHFVLAFHVRGAGAHLWEVLVGLVYLAIGIFVFLHPLAGLISLTLFLGTYLFVTGLFELIAGFTARGVPGSGWLLLNGAISVIIGILLWVHLPSTAVWAVGTLLGFAILFRGISRLAFALAARRSHANVV